MLGATIEVNNVKKHTYNDWNLKWFKVEISSPAPRKNYINVPGMDGKLDLSESLTGEINYENRKIKLIFEVEGDYEKWSTISSEIMNFLHGRQAKIIIDTDKCFYYVGRFELTSTKEDYLYGELILSGDVGPYKYEVNSSLEDWLWNDFNFENGIIREYKDLQVVNKLTVNVVGRRKTVYPTIESSDNMKANFNGTIYDIKKGTYRYLDMGLKEGDNNIVFDGNGIISIDYRGGSL